MAFPAPVRGTNKENWKKPAVQAELRTWSDRLSMVGIEKTPAELQAFSQKTTDQWVAARKTAIAPFEKYLRAVNARQAWYMFTGPDREPQRFTLEFTTKTGERVPVFEMGRSLSAPELVDPDFLYAYRVRRAILFASIGRGKDTFQLICRYFNRGLRKQRDDVKDVQCQLLQQRVEHPARVGQERPIKELRTLVIRPNGHERLTGDGLSKPKPRPERPERPRPVRRPEPVPPPPSATGEEGTVTRSPVGPQDSEKRGLTP